MRSSRNRLQYSIFLLFKSIIIIALTLIHIQAFFLGIQVRFSKLEFVCVYRAIHRPRSVSIEYTYIYTY